MNTDHRSASPQAQVESPLGQHAIDYVQVVQHLTPGGIEALALDLLGNADPDRPSLLISLEGSSAESSARWPRLQEFGGRLTWLGKAAGLQPALLLHLVKLFRRHQVQTVHTHHIGPLLYAGLAARLAGVPTLIHTEHDAWHLQSRKRALLQRGVLWLTRPRLVADAQQVANNMLRFIGSRTVNVIRNGVDSERFRPGDRTQARQRLGLPEGVRLIGNSGRLEPVKGQRYLIEALALMPASIHLAIAGSGSQSDALRQLADSLGIAERVHFLGHLDDMPSFYQALDLFCLPSINEGFPLSALEAQACSVTTAVTDVGAAKETLCPDTGLLLKPRDAAAMAVSLSDALSTLRHANPRDYDPRNYVVNTADLRKTRAQYRALAS